jgi:NPCBM/NEW2 domain
MPRISALLVMLFLGVTLVRGAELSLVTGGSLKQDVVTITDKEVTYVVGGKNETRPITDILKIDFREAKTLPPVYADLELTDGTVLHCSKWLVKKKQVELTLLNGVTLTVPLESLSNVLNNAQVETNRKDWSTRLANKRTSDVLVRVYKGSIQGLPCTLGEGNEAGDKIELAAKVGDEVKTVQRALADIHGLIFRRTLDPTAPPVTCKVLDTTLDVVLVSGLAFDGKTLTVSTPAGAKLTFPADEVVRIDYTKGRYEYLSDLEPKLTTRSNVEDGYQAIQQHVYKDASFKQGRKQIQVGGTSYSKGLILRPYTEMEFDLKGEYRDFSAVVGLEDDVGSVGPVVLTVEADGALLATFTFKPDDKKRFQIVQKNVKDVQRLRIVVKSGDLFELGKHVVLADVRVSK